MAPTLTNTFYSLLANKHFMKFTIYLGISAVFLVTIYNIIPRSTTIYLLSEYDTATCKPPTRDLTCKSPNHQVTIPNIANFVFILRDPLSDFPLQFSHFLSLYSAWHYWNPTTIYLHTNVDADSEAIQRAKNGTAGNKWAQKFFNFPNLQINTITVPTTAANGRPINKMEHKSDFVRVKAVHDFGGIYIDFDVYALQDIKPLRESGYTGIGGKQNDGYLNSGTFMSVKGGAMIKAWMDTMNKVYDGSWVRHSNDALTDVSKIFGRDSCDALVLDQPAFAPTGYKPYDSERLFHEYYDDSGLVKMLSHGKKLPDDQNFLRADSEGWVSWKKDWSCSYLLHAFSNKKPRNGVNQNGISPASVLARRSIFAKTVYPVVKHMYDNGVIDGEYV